MRSRLQAVDALWEAALSGAVESALGKLLCRSFQPPVQPNTCHPASGEWLVLQICDTCTLSNDMDVSLTALLTVLDETGWSLAVQHPRTFQNALHVLVAQPQRYRIACRLRFLLALASRKHTCMLAARNRMWQLPEQVAAVHREGAAMLLLGARRGSARACWRRIAASIRPALAGRSVAGQGLRRDRREASLDQALGGWLQMELLQADGSDGGGEQQAEALEIGSQSGASGTADSE